MAKLTVAVAACPSGELWKKTSSADFRNAA